MNVDVSYLAFYNGINLLAAAKGGDDRVKYKKRGKAEIETLFFRINSYFHFLLHKYLNEIAVAAVHLNDLSDHSALGQLDDLCKIDVAEGT